MLKKGILIIFVFLFSVFTLSFILAQNPLDGFVQQIDNVTGRVENTAEKVERLSREEVKWLELGARWKEMLLKNPVVFEIDNLFKKGNIIFVVLFGRDYSLSLTLFFLIILWLYFWSQFNKIIGTFSSFSSGTSIVISLGMTIILAQLKFFDWASEILFKLIFFREDVWGWIWAIGGFLVVIFVGMIIGNFFSSLKKSVLKFKKEDYKKKLLGELEQKNKFFAIIIDAFRGM